MKQLIKLSYTSPSGMEGSYEYEVSEREAFRLVSDAVENDLIKSIISVDGIQIHDDEEEGCEWIVSIISIKGINDDQPFKFISQWAPAGDRGIILIKSAGVNAQNKNVPMDAMMKDILSQRLLEVSASDPATPIKWKALENKGKIRKIHI